jgi:RTX calcium-binding nonapeptide repeat (4 copies)/LVIVD repeat
MGYGKGGFMHFRKHRHARWLIGIACAATLIIPGSALGQVDPPSQSDNVTVLSRTAPTNAATNADLAFFSDNGTRYTVAGNYAGFRIIDTTDPVAPVTVADFACNGPQSDVSVAEAADGSWYLFQSIDTPQTVETCNSTNTTYAATPNAFEGVRIFDISDPANPEFVESVPTDCGSHTHTLVPGSHTSLEGDENLVYLYISSYPLSGISPAPLPGGETGPPNANGTECQPPHKKISIVRVDLADPGTADDPAPPSDPPDPDGYANIWERGQNLFTKLFDTGTVAFAACHDIAVALGVNPNHNNPGDWAAGACFEEGQLWDISNPINPVFVNRWRNDNNTTIDLYHSAGFTWDGKIIIFGDEAGGGGEARCRFTKDQQGRFWFHEFDSMKIVGSYKIPRSQPALCTAHIYNPIPNDKNRYLLSSSWYTGGTSVVDFSNPTEPKEIAWHAVKPIDGQPNTMPGSNVWTTYWYQGNFYAHGVRGLEILDVAHSAFNRTQDFPEGAVNPQTQLDMWYSDMGCTVFGTAGPDTLKGTGGADVICGYGGADEIYGFSGADRILAGEGRDLVFGGNGADIVRGDAGHDEIYGEGGHDTLHGETGDDFLSGGPSNDTCRGGTGSDFTHSC